MTTSTTLAVRCQSLRVATTRVRLWPATKRETSFAAVRQLPARSTTPEMNSMWSQPPTMHEPQPHVAAQGTVRIAVAEERVSGGELGEEQHGSSHGGHRRDI